jgi:hypothetical protein
MNVDWLLQFLSTESQKAFSAATKQSSSTPFYTLPMLVLFETPAGFALFNVLDDSKIEDSDNLFKHFQTPDAANKV